MRSLFALFFSIMIALFFCACEEDPVRTIAYPKGPQNPTCTIISPKDSSIVGGSLWIRAEAMDDDGIARVEFIIDGDWKSPDYTAPYEYFWNTHPLSNGTQHVIWAVAYDTDGLSASSGPVLAGINQRTGPPKPVTLLSVTPDYSEEALVVSWTESVEDEFNQYMIRRSDTPYCNLNSPIIAAMQDRAATQYVDDAIEPNIEYYYRIYTEDTDRMASASNKLGGMFITIPGECNFGRLLIEKSPNNPVLTPGDARLSTGGLSPSVVFHDGQYYMYVWGRLVGDPQIRGSLSADGENWSWYHNFIDPVLEVGDSSDFDSDEVKYPEAIYDEEENLFKMWYMGVSNDVACVGYAESPDGF